MRNEYLNDIGDYIKYALLRQLAGVGPGDERSRRNLGVLWFLTVHPEANNDGSHRSYLTHDGYAALDPSLFSAMRLLERAVLEDGLFRSVHLLQDGPQGGDYLPGARFHTSPLERIMGHGNAVPERRRAQRRDWWTAARQAVAGCRVVFVDPDNGLRPRSVRDGYIDEPKYCRRCEVVDLIGQHDLVVVYQHSNQSVSWATLRSTIVASVREDLRAAGRTEAAQTPVHTLVASTFGRRGFICFARTPSLADRARTAIEALIVRAGGGPLDGKLWVESD